jgi:hypothetical protein
MAMLHNVTFCYVFRDFCKYTLTNLGISELMRSGCGVAVGAVGWGAVKGLAIRILLGFWLLFCLGTAWIWIGSHVQETDGFGQWSYWLDGQMTGKVSLRAANASPGSTRDYASPAATICVPRPTDVRNAERRGNRSNCSSIPPAKSSNSIHPRHNQNIIKDRPATHEDNA